VYDKEMQGTVPIGILGVYCSCITSGMLRQLTTDQLRAIMAGVGDSAVVSAYNAAYPSCLALIKDRYVR
jgi:hypothetical protein